MPDGKPSAKILEFATRGALILEARKKPAPKYPMIEAAEHERIAENARRNRDALERLSEMPSDSEPA